MKPFTFVTAEAEKDVVLSRLSTVLIQTGVNSFPYNMFRKHSHGDHYDLGGSIAFI